ncbi:hypothetical protein C0V97_00955 [Asaia sp. W19]|uniref:hypothetical protein n=1 Tax=unclassified Asaia TaxID=2685023 RepID=UPI000F8CC314|nr:hypothetical protein [Asaia sp. W19]RUT27368.1 hypothetical protein C0V97_00955 [Asaia sp. W19]
MMTPIEHLPARDKLTAVNRALSFHRTMPFGLHKTPERLRMIAELEALRSVAIAASRVRFPEPGDVQ